MRGNHLTEKSLPITVQKYTHTEAEQPEAEAGADSLLAAERKLILHMLEQTGGNKSEAARRLGITRKTLLNKLTKYLIS